MSGEEIHKMNTVLTLIKWLTAATEIVKFKIIN